MESLFPFIASPWAPFPPLAGLDGRDDEYDVDGDVVGDGADVVGDGAEVDSDDDGTEGGHNSFKLQPSIISICSSLDGKTSLH